MNLSRIYLSAIRDKQIYHNPNFGKKLFYLKGNFKSILRGCFSAKGQLISKCLFGVFNFLKKTTKTSQHALPAEMFGGTEFWLYTIIIIKIESHPF